MDLVPQLDARACGPVSGSPVVVMVQSTHDRYGNHFASCILRGRNVSVLLGDLLPNPLMGSCLVEVGHIGLEHALELLLLQDQQVIQAFLTNTPQEAFTDGIGSRSVIRRLENLDTTCPRHTSKAWPKLTVVITNEVLGCVPIRGGFSQLLGHPGIRRRACHADMDHPSRLQFYDEEGKERPKEEIGDLQEVACPDLCGVIARDRSTTSDLVAGVNEPSSCTSGWYACRRAGPVSAVPHEYAQHPTVDSPSPSA